LKVTTVVGTRRSFQAILARYAKAENKSER